jgi:hypothetical protein
MPKWLLYGLAAIATLVIAVLAYRSGRVLIPLVLVVASVSFIIAAAGAAWGAGRSGG